MQLAEVEGDGVMRKVILLMGMGLNGVGAEGWIPSIGDEDEAKELHEEMWGHLKSVDTFLLGRVCYDLWARVWPPLATDPRSSAFEKEFSRFADRVHKVVFSRTLKSLEWKNSSLVRADIRAEVERMKSQGGKNIAIVGGPGIARTLNELGLIDEYQLWVHPIILAGKDPLFGAVGAPRDLQLIRGRIFPSGCVSLHFEAL